MNDTASQQANPANPANPFAVATQRSATVEAAASRSAQEVQAAMVIAKKFPRDQVAAYERIMQACKRRSLAEVAEYVYPRGSTQITGPSIRLAEVIAQNWGNFEAGVVELERHDGESTVMAYAWDLETNARDVKVFTIKHVRETKKGNYTLDDPRDIYELVANQGARRKRACILAVVPGDIVDAAREECGRTLATHGKNEPLIDRVRKMVLAFAELGVTQGMLEGRLGHKMDATIEQELVNLRRIYTSIRDGMGKRDEFFAFETKPPEGLPADQSGGQLAKAKKKGKEPAQPASPPTTAEPAAPDTPSQTSASETAPTDGTAIGPAIVARIRKLLGDAGVTEAQLMALMLERKVSRDGQKELSELATSKLMGILENLDEFVAEIKAKA